MVRTTGRMAFLAGSLALLLFLALPALAQTISGVIAGVVKDPQGAPLAAVSIIVTNPGTGRSYVASTDDQGYYRIPEIPPGEYQVTAELGGFQTEKHTRVRVSVNRLTLENFALQIPPKVEVVEVISRAPMTDTTGATLSTTFPDRQVSELPILTRDINNLALLAPGVVSVRTFSFASTLLPFSVNGSRGRDNNFIIDSVDNNEPLFGGAAAQFTNTDIFAEYTILTHQMKAEFGRNSGATVNVITKSGSNFHHGSIFWFGQNDAFNARTRVEKTALLGSPASFYENLLGFTLGGPFRKDKTFYFISYQWDRARNNLSNVYPVVSTLPTPAGLATLKSFTQTPHLAAYLASAPSISLIPSLSAPCFSSVPPADPTASTTNPCFPAVLVDPEFVPTGLPFVEYATYLIPNANIFDVRDHQASVRIDHRFSNTDDLYGRYLIDDLKTPRAPLAPAGEAAFSDLGLLPEYRNILEQRTQSLLLNERHYFVNSLNEFRFSYTRIEQNIGALGVPESIREFQPALTITDNFGSFGAFQGLFPAAGIRFSVGRDSRPTETTSNIFGVQDNFSFNRGRHGFKLGVNLVRVRSAIRSMPSDLGQYFYGEASFGIPGFPLFILDPPVALATLQRFTNVLTDSSGNITGQGQDTLDLREFDQFYFFQDDIRVNPKFTLSLGLRYELPGQPINRIRKLNPDGPRVDRDINNLAPRIGFAWSPWERTVFRGGYGIMYNQMPLNIPLLLWQNGPISPFFTSTGTGFGSWQPSGVYPNQPYTLADVNVRVPDCSNFFFRTETVPVARLDKNVPLLRCFSQEEVDPQLVNPYIQHFSLTLQQELTPSLLLDIGWVGSKGTKLYQRVDVNPYCFEGDLSCIACTDPTDGFCLNPRHQFRPDGTRGAVTRVTNSGRSTYHSLQFNLTKRMTRTRVGDFTFTGSYTWSHLIDTSSEIFGPGVRFLQGDPFAALLDPLFSLETVEAITPLAQDNRNLSLEKGNSAFDRRQRLAASYLWEIAPDKGFWKGGWQVSGIVSLQSGQPFTPLNGLGACVDFNGDGRFTNDRPSVGNPDAPADSVALFSDPDCFIDANSSYVDLLGNPIDPTQARFVQTPLGTEVSPGVFTGLRPGQTFTVGSATLTAGDSGRNILTGPGIVNVDIAFYKNFRWGEGRILQLRWEIYDLFNTPNPGSAIGNVFATDAQPTPGFAFFPSKTPARVTGVIPENLLNASDPVSGERTFLSRAFMNTSSRRMQFGVKFIF